MSNEEIYSGIFYSFTTYLDLVNKKLVKYSNQPVMFYIDNHGTFVVNGILPDFQNKVVHLEVEEIDHINNYNYKVLTLTELLEKMNDIKEKCFDFVPLLTEFQDEGGDYKPSLEKNIPIFEAKIGISKDETLYAFIISSSTEE